MHDDLDSAQLLDSRFLRAIGAGVALGIPVMWAVLTIIFSIVAKEGWVTAFGYSAVPAIFCGPFIGGLFTTSRVHGSQSAEADAEGIVVDLEESRAA
ncbi:MAG: hypothetical protein JF603_09065 [Acidobacteria bacterium]|nr:hypothetical protein [Acidobacteriota bacterium]